MFFSDIDIRKCLETKDLVINPLDDECITPVGYDARIGNIAYLIYPDGSYKVVDIDSEGELRIDGRTTALIGTREYIELSGKIAGAIHSKVTLVSKGLSHISTTLDPGWKGKLLIQIHNHLDVTQILEPDETFCTLVFYELKTETESPHKKPPFRVDISEYIEKLSNSRRTDFKSKEALNGLEDLLNKRNEIDSKLEKYKLDKIVMMSDEVGSVTRQDKYKDNEAAACTMQQRSIIMNSVANFGGYAKETGGDGMVSSFETKDCEKAIHAAVDIQKKLVERNRNYPHNDQNIFVRIGIDIGKIFVERGELKLGLILSRTARIMSVAISGQIFISAYLYKEVYKMKDYSFESKGKYLFEGLSNKVEVYEVIWREEKKSI